MKTSIRYVLAGLLLSGVLIGTIFVLRSQKKVPSAAADDVFRSWGPETAPIQIIEYSDFQCPACANAQPILKVLLASHPGEIRLIYQHFPLQSHVWSRWAHQAAECAAVQDKFWAYHDRLYAAQAEWSKAAEAPLEFFVRYAREEGLNLDEFGRCLSDPKPAETIREETLAGEDLAVRSTPTFFVNGQMVVGAQKLSEKVAELLQK